ncbi:MAG: hypothetical protein ABR573_02975 [Candidatus Dormibacteria bacterium]
MALTAMPVATQPAGRSHNRLLKYPPLLLLIIGLTIGVTVLPSALNMQQTNPTETAEYAPVPPTDSNVPPGGNVGQLGLAGSSSQQTGFSSDKSSALPPDGSQGSGQDQQQVIKVPSTFRCVGKPPRQTEDPFSPPCVAYFNGDNGGSTYQGVDANEIRIIVYWEGGDGGSSPAKGNACYFNSAETRARPPDTYFDFDKDPAHSSSNPDYPESQSDYATGLRSLTLFFNQHYQLYHRHVHMRMWHARLSSDPDHPAPTGCPTAADRQADANEQITTFHPFGVMDNASSNNEAYEQYMNAHGVVTFITQNPLAAGSLVGRHESDLQQYPGLNWSYVPSVETAADWTAKWMCKEIVNPNGQPGVVYNTGNPLDKGKPRKYGFIRANDKNVPLLNAYGKMVEDKVKACGADVVSEMLLPRAGYNIITPSRTDPTSNGYAQTGIADFIQNHVTTVLWGGGDDNNPSNAATASGYFPEWVVAGDRFFETVSGGFYQDQSQWKHMVVDSQVELVPGQYQQDCYLAYADADPNAVAPGQFESVVACRAYPDFRLLFTGLQIAGPKLSPSTLDQGFHNIPKVSSDRPELPTCYFEPGNYTCIKDAEFMWWDQNKSSPDGNTGGCYRMIKGGHRWTQGNWDPGDAFSLEDPVNDPCNDY